MSKYNEVLQPFMQMMDAELHANSSRGDRPGWLSMTAEQCLLEIYYHVSKLQKAVREGSGDRIKENTADVANMAMMLADICGALEMAQPSDGALTNEGAGPVAWQVQAICSDGSRMGWREVSKGQFQEAFASAALSASAGGHVDWECRELYSRAVFPASVALKVCTCPSGDGSLRWPCPVHPPEVKAVVLPEREMYSKYLRGVIPDNRLEVEAYKDGWNACLDRVKELNS